jgi:hypothetical protein
VNASTSLRHCPHLIFCFFFFFTPVAGPSRSLSLKLSDTRVYEPQIRARLDNHASVCVDVFSAFPPPHAVECRGASLIRKRAPLGPCSRTLPRALWGFYGSGRVGAPKSLRHCPNLVSHKLPLKLNPHIYPTQPIYGIYIYMYVYIEI